eukprot:1161915-Pelagomonas_calceolata.AAC.4
MHNFAQVAVKCVRVSQATEQLSFLREVEALSSLRHPHVLPFLGACMLDLEHFWLVTEFMEKELGAVIRCTQERAPFGCRHGYKMQWCASQMPCDCVSPMQKVPGAFWCWTGASRKAAHVLLGFHCWWCLVVGICIPDAVFRA